MSLPRVLRWLWPLAGLAFTGWACSRESRSVPRDAGGSRRTEVQKKSERVAGGASMASGQSSSAVAGGTGSRAPGPSVGSVPERPARLEAESQVVALEVPGYGPAIAWLPLGTTSVRPLIVATHGNYDTPESTCYVWGSIVASRGFVLCPRGAVRPDSPSRTELVYHYLGVPALEKEIDAALESLESRYRRHLDAQGVIYSGFSQGAIMGAHILQRNGKRYPRAVMIEGGFDQWNRYSGKAYASGGGERILFACGQWDCDIGSKKAAKRLGAVGVASRVVSALGSGHTYGGDVADQLRAAFDWLIEGDPRWGSDGLSLRSSEK